jgi:hypothetical protein
MIDWHEPLPDECPPKDAFTPNENKFYRLVKTNPPTSSDFHSHRYTQKNKPFPGLSECIVRSVSIWSDPSKCVELKKLPTHKNKFIAELVLKPSDGLVAKTLTDIKHYSWWRSKATNVSEFNILP